MMKKYLLLVCLVCLIAGCSGGDGDKDVLSKNWGGIKEEAGDSLVRLYMYGGQPEVNAWFDTYVADQVKKRFGITLVRVPIGADVVVAKLMAEKEKANGNDSIGDVDLFWLNGANFKTAREAGVLFGPFAEKLPNYVKHVNKQMAAYDFGYPVAGYEVPLGWTQFVFEYATDRIQNPPRTWLELLNWVKANPGRFTYPAPPDFTGSAFVRQVFYAVTGGPKMYLSGWDEKLYEKGAPKVWGYLEQMQPHLWNGGHEFPANGNELDTLFASGEIDICMAYGPQHSAAKKQRGVLDRPVQSFVMTGGTLYNMHYLAIPENASNKAGAMVVANFLLSPEAQYVKYLPKNWGDFPSINLDTLDKTQWADFANVKLDESTLSPDVLHKAGVPEIAAEYVLALEKGWVKNVQ